LVGSISTSKNSPLETQRFQLAIAIEKREERKLMSYPIKNPKGQNFEWLKAVMVLR